MVVTIITRKPAFRLFSVYNPAFSALASKIFKRSVLKDYTNTPIPEKTGSYTETRLYSPRGRYSK